MTDVHLWSHIVLPDDCDEEAEQLRAGEVADQAIEKVRRRYGGLERTPEGEVEAEVMAALMAAGFQLAPEGRA